MTHYYGLQYPTGELVALDQSSANSPYKTDIRNAWLLEDPTELKQYRDMYPTDGFMLVFVSIEIEPAR